MIVTGQARTSKCGGPPIEYAPDGQIGVYSESAKTFVYVSKVDPKGIASISKWKALIADAAARNGLPEAWIAGFMLQESRGNQNALSPAGAIGLMQLMPISGNFATAASIANRKVGSADLKDPTLNVLTGAKLLRTLADSPACNWNVVHMAASYNAGKVICSSKCDGKYQAGWGWHVVEDCGYVGHVIQSINAAVVSGQFNGTIESRSVKATARGIKAFVIAAGIVAAVGYAWTQRAVLLGNQ